MDIRLALQAYAGKVRSGIDHKALKPAAWRVDDYLNVDEDEAADLDDLRGHTLVFAKTGLDTMDRNMDLDNLVASLRPQTRFLSCINSIQNGQF